MIITSALSTEHLELEVEGDTNINYLSGIFLKWISFFVNPSFLRIFKRFLYFFYPPIEQF